MVQTPAPPEESLEEGQRELYLLVALSPCGHLSSQLRTLGRPATMRCLQHTMVLHSPVELISGQENPRAASAQTHYLIVKVNMKTRF